MESIQQYNTQTIDIPRVIRCYTTYVERTNIIFILPEVTVPLHSNETFCFDVALNLPL